MSNEKEIVDGIEALVKSLIPPLPPPAGRPVELEVISLTQGRGIGLLNGERVDLLAHPKQYITNGSMVVAVPIARMRYYVVGKI